METAPPGASAVIGGPPAAPADDLPPAGVANPVTCEPGASSRPCHYVSLWQRFLRDDVRLPDAWVRDHLQLVSWEMATRGDPDTFVLHYQMSVDWAVVSMNDGFVVRRGGADVPDDAILASLRAHTLVGSNEPHAWQLRPRTRIVDRDAARKKVSTCPGIVAPTASEPPLLDDTGLLYLHVAGTPSGAGSCPFGNVDLDSGKVWCQPSGPCMVFGGSPSRAALPTGTVLPHLDTACQRDEECGVTDVPTTGDYACCGGQCGITPATRASIQRFLDACDARASRSAGARKEGCPIMQCKPMLHPPVPKCQAGRCVAL
ncbi:MAG TPA: hypothetical protein VHE30_20375 [Polyangiaceae bacterium]|nr:hypothetical protein [Polyangiaceae bacterium]